MRQILVQVPQGVGSHVMDRARDHDATIVHAYEARTSDGAAVDVVVVHVPNREVGRFVDALDAITDAYVSLVPTGVLTLKPPASEVAEQLQDVSSRSPLEVFLAGLQSVGSWPGFLGYAAAAGAVVWLGLFTDAVYLLVAAMLIAPFAGPAMNAAIATARGDALLLGRALLRYAASLSVTVAVSGLLSLLFRQDVLTSQMAATANISSAAIVLPLAAGAAGALHLVQGERSNLVSGASVGMLVAASLAPPAGLLGMAVALAKWDLIPGAFFLLLLQLLGINLAGAAIFRFGGLAHEGPRYSRGRSWVAVASIAVSVVGLAALMAWQLASTPELQRSTVQQRARDVVRHAMDDIPEVRAASIQADFTRPDIPGQRTLLVRVHAQDRRRGPRETEALRQRIMTHVQRAIQAEWGRVTPLVEVTVLAPPE